MKKSSHNINAHNIKKVDISIKSLLLLDVNFSLMIEHNETTIFKALIGLCEI